MKTIVKSAALLLLAAGAAFAHMSNTELLGEMKHLEVNLQRAARNRDPRIATAFYSFTSRLVTRLGDTDRSARVALNEILLALKQNQMNAALTVVRDFVHKSEATAASDPDLYKGAGYSRGYSDGSLDASRHVFSPRPGDEPGTYQGYMTGYTEGHSAASGGLFPGRTRTDLY